MMRALFLKELRSLRPFIFIGAALVLIEAIGLFWSPLEAEAFDLRLASVAFGLTVTQIGLGFALGTGLLVREIDDGTLNFLDGLPLTRRAVFLAKVMAAMLVLALQPLCLILMHALVQLGMRESLDHMLHAGLLLTFFGLALLVSALGLTLGMLLGFLRYLSWLVLGLCVIGIVLLKDTAPSLAAVLNTADLLTLRFTGTAWQLPLAAIWTQAGAALLFALLALALFQTAGGVLARVRKWRALRRLLPAMLVLALVGGVFLFGRRQASEVRQVDRQGADGVDFTPIAGGHAASRHYTFSYPALSSERLAPFIAGADQTFAEVAALLGVDGGAPIDVDLWGTTANHAGTAYHDRIRMHVSGAASKDVLAHETAHVFSMRLAGSEYGRQLGGMVVFNEGLAYWIENRVAMQGVREEQELVAAIVSKRRLVAPRQLADFAQFSSAVDENLKYPLGAIFVEQVVRRYGAAAPATVLKTLAREDFPRDLDGYVLWQAAFQLSGFDLDLVFDDYARHLAQLELKYARQIAAMPRPRGSLVGGETGYKVALRFDQPLPQDVFALVRFRPGKMSSSVLYKTSFSLFAPDGERFAVVPEDIITRGEVCFQPGVMRGGIFVYEPWVCLPASSARMASMTAL